MISTIARPSPEAVAAIVCFLFFPLGVETSVGLAAPPAAAAAAPPDPTPAPHPSTPAPDKSTATAPAAASPSRAQPPPSFPDRAPAPADGSDSPSSNKSPPAHHKIAPTAASTSESAAAHHPPEPETCRPPDRYNGKTIQCDGATSDKTLGRRSRISQRPTNDISRIKTNATIISLGFY